MPDRMLPEKDDLMNQEDANHSFDQFSREEFYTSVNRTLLDLLSLRAGQIVVDLGCGNGEITRLLSQMAEGITIIAVDQSAERLKEAEANLGAAGSSITFTQASAEELSSVIRAKVDTVIFCNAIHMVADKAIVINEISKVLKPGGCFAFNTAFFEGAMPSPSLAFYRRLMLKAIRILRRDYGLTHRRGVSASTRQFLSPVEYRSLLSAHRFGIRREEIIETHMPFSAVQAILTFEDFVAGALPGVPMSIGSKALKEAASEAFRELGMDYLPRNWLQVVAEKN